MVNKKWEKEKNKCTCSRQWSAEEKRKERLQLRRKEQTGKEKRAIGRDSRKEEYGEAEQLEKVEVYSYTEKETVQLCADILLSASARQAVAVGQPVETAPGLTLT